MSAKTKSTFRNTGLLLSLVYFSIFLNSELLLLLYFRRININLSGTTSLFNNKE